MLPESNAPLFTIEVGNLRTRLVGPVPQHIVDMIDTTLSYEIPGAEHAKKFNPYAGTVHLFSKYNNSFPTGLLSYVRPIIKNANLPARLLDKRHLTTRGEPLPLHDVTLREYQAKAVDTVIEKTRAIVKAGTGAGKTTIFTAIVAKLNVNTLILIHKTDVFNQIVETLERILRIKVGRIGDGVLEIEKVTVAMVQSVADAWTLSRKVDRKNKTTGRMEEIVIHDSEEVKARKYKIQAFIENVECIITDEVHHVTSTSFRDVHKRAEKAMYRIGMSASPWREDNADLLIEAYNGPIAVDIPASWLIDNGYLTPPLVQLYNFRHPRKDRKGVRYATIYDEAVMNNDARNQLIAEIALKAVAANKTVLIAVTKVEHGRILETLLKDIEPTTMFVSGESNSELRKTALTELDNHTRKIVIATTIFGEGVDCPGLDVLINAKAAASSVEAFQLLGRVLRLAPGKTKAYVVDIFDAGCKFLGAHATDRLEIYQTEPRYKIQHVSSMEEVTFNDAGW